MHDLKSTRSCKRSLLLLDYVLTDTEIYRLLGHPRYSDSRILWHTNVLFYESGGTSKYNRYVQY